MGARSYVVRGKGNPESLSAILQAVRSAWQFRTVVRITAELEIVVHGMTFQRNNNSSSWSQDLGVTVGLPAAPSLASLLCVASGEASLRSILLSPATLRMPCTTREWEPLWAQPRCAHRIERLKLVVKRELHLARRLCLNWLTKAWIRCSVGAIGFVKLQDVQVVEEIE